MFGHIILANKNFQIKKLTNYALKPQKKLNSEEECSKLIMFKKYLDTLCLQTQMFKTSKIKKLPLNTHKNQRRIALVN